MVMGAAEKINSMSGAANTNWLRTIGKIIHLVNPIDNRAKIVTYPLLAAALILLPLLPQLFFMACNCGDKSRGKNYPKLPYVYSGQIQETIAFTTQEYNAGRITRDEKITLDNAAIAANSKATASGLRTQAEEMPGDWERFKK